MEVKDLLMRLNLIFSSLKKPMKWQKKYLIVFIKKNRISEKCLNQIIGPLTTLSESEKDLEIIIVY